MRRTILSAGVLCLILAADVNGQAAKNESDECRDRTANCERSQFDYLVSSTGALAFDYFFWSIDGLRLLRVKRLLQSRTALAPGLPSDSRSVLYETPRTVSGEDRVSVVSTGEVARRIKSGHDLERPNAPDVTEWDWLLSLRAAHQADSAELKADSDDATARHEGSHSGVSRNIENEHQGGGVAPGNRDGSESPKAAPPNDDQKLESDLTPEPSTLLLIGSGLPLALAFVRGRRRR